MGETPSIKFNPEVRLFLSDVDETVADLFVPAVPEMMTELTSLLESGRVIFFISGAGYDRLQERVVDAIPAHLRNGVLISHCSGAEVVGYDETGELRPEPFYSLYDKTLSQEQKDGWRGVVRQLVEEFHLEVHEAEKINDFKARHGDNPLAVMLEDRGPQITFEFVNSYDLSPEQVSALETTVPRTRGAFDLRIPVMERADELLQQAGIPVTSRLGGIFALDLALKGVSKTLSITHLLENTHVLESVGLTAEDVADPAYIEIWGDRFDQFRGGTDRHMQEAVDPAVRAIDFRKESSDGFLEGYNTVVWDGDKQLHEGLLEYLQLSNF